jgi:hypothetical protein
MFCPLTILASARLSGKPRHPASQRPLLGWAASWRFHGVLEIIGRGEAVKVTIEP